MTAYMYVIDFNKLMTSEEIYTLKKAEHNIWHFNYLNFIIQFHIYTFTEEANMGLYSHHSSCVWYANIHYPTDRCFWAFQHTFILSISTHIHFINVNAVLFYQCQCSFIFQLLFRFLPRNEILKSWQMSKPSSISQSYEEPVSKHHQHKPKQVTWSKTNKSIYFQSYKVLMQIADTFQLWHNLSLWDKAAYSNWQ